ncbi:hypothetical protein KKD52_18645 [Myxococcota bacterium]|nr:hypothetical protein [Myxococcota bacterium]MBU1512376.1 hypothetical protein [Myxococcota bacterium]
MKTIFILLCSVIILSCDSDDPLTQADCERITDETKCFARGCYFVQGQTLITDGSSCVFTENSDLINFCYLSESGMQEQIGADYCRALGDGQYQVISLSHTVDIQEGWVECEDLFLCSHQ